MFDWALLAELALGLIIIGAALYFRAAIVSLNESMRAILAGQSELRARLDALEDAGQTRMSVDEDA
jgi:hypothetical protein